MLVSWVHMHSFKKIICCENSIYHQTQVLISSLSLGKISLSSNFCDWYARRNTCAIAMSHEYMWWAFNIFPHMKTQILAPWHDSNIGRRTTTCYHICWSQNNGMWRGSNHCPTWRFITTILVYGNFYYYHAISAYTPMENKRLFACKDYKILTYHTGMLL